LDNRKENPKHDYLNHYRSYAIRRKLIEATPGNQGIFLSIKTFEDIERIIKSQAQPLQKPLSHKTGDDQDGAEITADLAPKGPVHQSTGELCDCANVSHKRFACLRALPAELGGSGV
jgi:hypothetical protein